MAIEEVPENVIEECFNIYRWVESECFNKCRCIDCDCYIRCIENLEQVYVDSECYELKRMGLI